MHELIRQGFQVVVPNDEMVREVSGFSRCLCQSVQSERRCVHAQMGIYHDRVKTEKKLFQAGLGPAYHI